MNDAVPGSSSTAPAIVWPPGRASWLVAAFYERPDTEAATRNATLADAARSLVVALG